VLVKATPLGYRPFFREKHQTEQRVTLTKARASITICVAYLVAIGLSGCSVDALTSPTKINLFQSYPPGPVVSTFDCSLLDVESETARDKCVMPSQVERCDKQPQDCETRSKCACQNDEATKKQLTSCGGDEQCRAGVLDECMQPQTLDCALGCVSSTQQAYGTFLRCSEKRQLIAGFAIATLGASSATIAAAGLSTVAAASLGGAAGAGLGYDYVFYNKARRGAYANGTVQLQCVASETHSVAARTSQFTSSKLQRKDVSDYLQTQADMVSNYTMTLRMDSVLKKSSLYDACKNKDPLKPEIEMLAELTAKYTQIEGSSALVAAQVKIGLEVQNHVSARLDQLGTDIVSTVDTIDVRAFAAAQAGVPDSDQLAKALQAATSGLTKGAPSAPVSGAPKGPLVSLEQFQSDLSAASDCTSLDTPVNQALSKIKTTDGLIDQIRSGTNNLNSQVVRLNASVAALKLPDPTFSDCLSIQPPPTDKPSPSLTKQSSPAPSGTPSTGVTPATGQTNNTGGNTPDQTAKSPAPSDGSTSPAKGTSLAFTVSPSGTVSADAATGTATIKMLGGSSPYFVEVVDTEQIGAVSADSNSVVVQLLGEGASGRVLLADSAGASVLVTVKKASSSKIPGGGPGNTGGGGVVNNICVGSGGRCGGAPAPGGVAAPAPDAAPSDAAPNGAAPDGRGAPRNGVGQGSSKKLP
jgi:hypothetical protein